MTTTTPQASWRLVAWPVGLAFSRFVPCDAGVVAVYRCVISPQTLRNAGAQALTTQIFLGVSFITAIAMWYYTLWLTIAFFKRRRCVPKHYLSGCLFPYCWQ